MGSRFLRLLCLLGMLCLGAGAGGPAWAAFTVNAGGTANATVTDTVTGLEWDQCPMGLSGAACGGGTIGSYTWAQALTAATTANALSYKGHNDWRLPNVKELGTLVKIDAEFPAIDTTAFPGTPSTYFWSSTTYAPNPVAAWSVNFSDGSSYADIQPNTGNVRLVRSGQSFDTLAQTLTFGAAPTVTVGGTGTVSASSASPNSGNAIVYGVTTPLVCSVNASTGVVTGITAGSCTVTADQAAGATYYAAAQVTQTFNVGMGSQSLSFAAQSPSAQTFVASGTFSVNPLATANTPNSGNPIVYSSTTAGVCSVSGSTVTMLSVGTCTIAADMAGNANYNAAAQVTQSVAIGIAAQVITFNALAGKVFGTLPFTVSATGGASGLPVTFASTTPSICTTSGTNGSTVTLVAVGTCTIKASQAGNSNYAAASDVSQSFSISAASQTLSFAAQTPSAQTFAAGSTFSVNPLATASTPNSGNPIVYSSTTAGVCSVSGSTVTMLSAGTCTIAADLAGNANYSAAAQVTQSVAIGIAAQVITFAPLAGKVFGTLPFTVSATGGASGLPVTFASTTPTICTVSGSTVTLVTVGTCTIKASQAGSSNYTPASDVSQSFSISAASQTLSFAAQTPSAQTFAAGSTFSVNPLATASMPNSGNPIVYSSTTAGVCSVSGSTVTMLSVGTCTIAADLAGNANYNAAAQVTQSVAIGIAAQVITFAPLAGKVFGTLPFTVSATGGASGLPVTFVSTTPTICTTSGTNNSTVTLVTVGTCTIKASQAGNANYAAASDVSQSFSVSAASQTLGFAAQSPSTQTFAAGSTFSVNPLATATSGLTPTYSSLTATVCTVSGTTVTMVSIGTCTIAANQAGNSTYAAATQVVQSVAIVSAPITTSYAAPSSTGTGNIAASFTTSDAGCTFAPATSYVSVGSVATADTGYSYPQGLANLTITGCAPGAVVHMTITYPQALPAGAVYRKFGPTLANPTPHWYSYGTVSGATATLTLTDGGAGDDDLIANGSITDPGGAAVPDPAPIPATTSVPTLNEWLLMLLALLITLASGYGLYERSAQSARRGRLIL